MHPWILYTLLRVTLRPAVEPSVVDAGAVVFRAVAALFLTANDAVCVRGIMGFFVVVAAVVPAGAFRVPAPVRAGFITVVPEDAVDETVPVLFLRSCCLVAGRGGGERTGLGPVAARLAVFLACDAGWLLSLTVDVVAARERARAPSHPLVPVDFSGLEGFSGEVDRCPLSGDAWKGDCG